MKLLENVVYSLKTQTIFRNQLFGEPIVTKKEAIRALTIEEKAAYQYAVCCQPDSKARAVAELNGFMGGSFANTLLQNALVPDDHIAGLIRKNIAAALSNPDTP